MLFLINEKLKIFYFVFKLFIGTSYFKIKIAMFMSTCQLFPITHHSMIVFGMHANTSGQLCVGNSLNTCYIKK